MRRSLLYIGGSELQLPGIRWARAAGLDVVLTDASEQAPGRGLSERFHSVSGTDQEMLAALALSIDERAPFAGAYCSNDFGLGSVAAVGEATSTPANDPRAVARALDKHAAGLIWHASGIPTPATESVEDEQELRGALERLSLPAVIKPLASSGSRGVSAIRSADEAARAFREAKAQAPDRPVLVQAFADGHHVDVNAFFVRGVLHPGGILDRFFSEPPHCVPLWGCQPSRLGPDVEREIYRLVECAASALGIDIGPIKADVVVGEKEALILELTPRFHGDVSTAHVTPLATGRSPIQDWFAYLADPDGWSPPEPIEARRHAGWMAIFPDRPGLLERVRGVDPAREVEGIQGVTLLKPPGTRIKHLGDNRAVLGFLWAVAESRDELERSLREARERIEVIIE